MGLLSKLRGLVPPSSRSFHQMCADMNDMRRDGVRQYDALAEELASIRSESQAALGCLTHLEKRMITQNDHMKLYAQQLYRRDGEDNEEAMRRFFKNLPKATGAVRLQQLVCLQLLKDFDKLCEQHGLTYWMLSGTLLGAVRHNGFIPWDDDVDLGMPREDLNRLMDIVAQHDEYEVTERFDWHPRCRQVRFCYKNESIPSFLDLFLFDYATLAPMDAFERMQHDRKAMVAALVADPEGDTAWESQKYVTSDTDNGRRVASCFNEAIEREYAEDGFLTHDPAKAQSVIWGLDNVDSFTGCKITFPIDTLLPLQQLPFDDAVLYAPNDPDEILTTIFGDYLALPDTLGTHFEHIDSDILGSPDVIAAMKDVVGEEKLGTSSD